MWKTAAAKRQQDSSSSYVPVHLHPKQCEFVDDDRPDILFGGAAGGGKTVAQLASALKYAHVPGYGAVLIRRAYTHLEEPGAFIPLSRQWLSGKATYNQSRHRWTFPSGATLTFGYLDNERDLDRYQGAEYQYIGVDEATQIPEKHLRYLYSRLRRTAVTEVPLRMRLSSNPGGISHEYVKQRYIVEQHPERRFIPSLLQDNPSLDRDTYVQTLQNLDPLTRERLLNGDWDVLPEGGMFKRAWFSGHIVEDWQVPAGLRWLRYWDRAATEEAIGTDPDYTAGALVAFLDGVWYVRNIVRFRLNPEGNEQRIREVAQIDGHSIPIYMEQEPGSSGKDVIHHYARRVLSGFAFHAHRPTGSKVERAAPVASAAFQGLVKLVQGQWVSDFLDEAVAFPLSAHMDQVDAVSGAMAVINQRLAPVRTLKVRNL